MSDTPDKPPVPEWRKRDWASREAKKKEARLKKDAPWKDKLKWERANYEDDPEFYVEYLKLQDRYTREEIQEGIALKTIIEAGRSDDPRLVDMQKTINRMARASGLFKRPPKLVIHTRYSDDERAGQPDLNAGTAVPDFIEINVFTKNYFFKHPEAFKAVMAHEMGHIANGDCGVENAIKFNLMPPTQMQEILAERMAAIIHGNPKEYAKATSDYQFYVAKQDGAKPYRYYQDYLSVNGNARMLHKWADILEAEGATDKKGNVILDKALAVFERSKDFTAGLLKMDLAIRQR